MARAGDSNPGVDPNTVKSNEIARTVIGSGIHPDDFRVDFRDGTATVRGTVHSEDERRRVLDAARRVGGVSSVTDSLTVRAETGRPSTERGTGERTYTVRAGDTLSQIAKAQYGDASKFDRIFEANRNVLKDPDEIQPGQVLRIPD